MEKGELIGIGMTAEVYKWGEDKIIKLYYSKMDDSWIRHEHKTSTIIHEAGLPSPAVFDLVEQDGRKGIVFEYIKGQTMLTHIQREPWMLVYYSQQLARLHYSIHQSTAKSLPTQYERFEARMKMAQNTLGSRKKRLLEYINTLPNASSVCHGDFHFNNIIVSGDKLIPIDWMNSYIGNPLGDVARTCMMLSSPFCAYEIPYYMTIPLQYIKSLAYWSYVLEYINLSKTSFDKIDEWILPVAAAKLRDNMNGEEGWLNEIINERLAQLDKSS